MADTVGDEMTKIEWTDEVWNPVTGCTKVSQGCKHCYAERIAERFWGERKFTDVQCHEDRLNIPLHWRKPRRVFVNSMSDLFHPDVDFEFIKLVYRVMFLSMQHTFQILTKRPERMFEFTNWMIKDGIHMPISNVWLGVSCEDQAAADERIPWLLKTPAAVRFVSYEPALGPVDFTALNFGTSWESSALDGWYVTPDGRDEPDQHSDGNKLDWVIAGGESGPGARPAHPDWFRSVRDQCVEAGIPFFFKQWGEWIGVFEREWERRPDIAKNGLFERVGKKRAGRLLDGREWNEYPEPTR